MTPEMRIIGGTWGSRVIKSCSGGYRPTTALVKKSLFDSLASGIVDSRFLDLFSGTGAVGIEALSRGAGRVVFVESDWSRLKILHENLVSLDASDDEYVIIGTEYLKALEKLREEKEIFDFIYVDPPYGEFPHARILGDLVLAGILSVDGVIIYETHRKNLRELLEVIPDELYPYRERLHGSTALIMFRWRKGSGPGGN